MKQVCLNAVMVINVHHNLTDTLDLQSIATFVQKMNTEETNFLNCDSYNIVCFSAVTIGFSSIKVSKAIGCHYLCDMQAMGLLITCKIMRG